MTIIKALKENNNKKLEKAYSKATDCDKCANHGKIVQKGSQ